MKHFRNNPAILSILILLDMSTSLLLKENQQDALLTLRSGLKDTLVKSYMTQDEFLLPFLQAVKFNILRASAMIKKNMKWRKENGIDTILLEDNPIEAQTPYITGIDKSGRPVILVKVGDLDLRSFVTKGNANLALRYAWKAMETMATKARHANQTQIVVIADPSGFSIRRQACLNCLHLWKSMSETFEANYPGLAGAILFVKTPRLFQVVLNVYLTVASESSKKAMRVYGFDKGEWDPALQEWVSQTELNRMFGYDLSFTTAFENHTNYSQGSLRKETTVVKVLSKNSSNGKFWPTVILVNTVTMFLITFNNNLT